MQKIFLAKHFNYRILVTMNETPATKPQDLREAFASLISMMLGLLRAQGLRGLMYLPAMWRAAREIRRLGEEFVALYAAWQAGTLPPPRAPPRPDRTGCPRNPPQRRACPHARCPTRPSPASPTRARATRARGRPRAYPIPGPKNAPGVGGRHPR